MKQHRMTRDEHARWRLNRQYFRKIETGEVLRALTDGEVKAYEELIASGIRPEVLIDGIPCKPVHDRDLLKEEFIAQYGDVRLQRPSGMFVTVLRGSVERPGAPKLPEEPVCPHPDVCKCKGMVPAHPGRHHPNCAFNSIAEAAHRATPEDVERIKNIVLEFPAEAPEPVKLETAPSRAAQVPAGPVPTPDECYCRAWGNYNPCKSGTQHNPMCNFFDPWMKLHPEGFMLVDVESGEVLRAATAEEVTKTSADPAHSMKIGGKLYFVVETEAKAAE